MPGILDLVQQSLGGDTVQAIGHRLGADPQQTQSAIAAALPMLLAGLAHQSQSGGADALHAAVQQHDAGLLGDVAGWLGGGNSSGLPGLIGQMLGPHEEVAHAAVAGTSGLGAGQVQQLMALLAPVVMSALAQHSQQQGLNAGGLAALLQGEHQQVAQSVAQSQPGLAGLAGQLLGNAPSGNPLGNLAQELGGLFGGR